MSYRTSIIALVGTLALLVVAMPASFNPTTTMLAATLDATADSDQDQSPLTWPVTPATQQQVDDALACDLENLPAKRYPEKTALKDLKDSYDVETACDWAVLAVAYKGHVKEDDPAPQEGVEAFKQAVSINSALAFRLPILGAYYGTRELVEAPPLAQQLITRVKLTYAFSGIEAESVQITLTIDKANTDKPVVSGKSGVEKPTKISGTIDKTVVQALGAALTDLIPMQAQFTQQVCYDDYPDWEITLTFKDSTTIKVTNNQSNIYFFGGPVQTAIKKQNYTQYSDAFLEKLLAVLDELKLPKGETQGMYCYGVDKDPMTLAFPSMVPKPTATKKP